MKRNIQYAGVRGKCTKKQTKEPLEIDVPFNVQAIKYQGLKTSATNGGSLSQ